MAGSYKDYKRDVKLYIKDKLVILRDFGICDRRTEWEYRDMLEKAVKKSNEPYDVVLDRVTMQMIRKKLGAI